MNWRICFSTGSRLSRRNGCSRPPCAFLRRWCGSNSDSVFTQSQLEFLPERHTDFIFAVLAEELGLVGILILLALYILLIMRGLWIAARAQTTFGRVMAGGLMLILFVYVFVNIGMVSGILPVVGVPLPLVSYGGSALIVLMAGFGIVMSIHTHRKMLSKSV